MSKRQTKSKSSAKTAVKPVAKKSTQVVKSTAKTTSTAKRKTVTAKKPAPKKASVKKATVKKTVQKKPVTTKKAKTTVTTKKVSANTVQKTAAPKKAVVKSKITKTTTKAPVKTKAASAVKPKKPVTAKKTVTKKTVTKTTAKKPAATKSATAKQPTRKTVVKKTVSTKAAPAKTLTRKTASKVSTTQKTVTVKKKAAVTTAKRAVAAPKNPVVVTKSKSATARPAVRKQTTPSLQEHFDGVVSRLKAADTNTRKSVKSLQTAFSALENRVKSHKEVDHAALSKRVDQLSAYLTQSLRDTKRDIASDFKSALQSPSTGNVQAAITRSEQRLAETELAQAQSVARINKHIADLARVIDGKLKEQAGKTQLQTEKLSTLEEQVTSVQSQSYERIRLVENTTADAMRKLGDDVVSTAENFQNRLDSQNAVLKQRIEEIAAKTQETFDVKVTDLSRRMESVEDSQRNQGSYVDRSISKLAARIDSLEFGLSQTPEPIAAIVPPAAPESPALSPQDPPPLDSFFEEVPEEGAESEHAYDAFAAADAEISAPQNESLTLGQADIMPDMVPELAPIENFVPPAPAMQPPVVQPLQEPSPYDGLQEYNPGQAQSTMAAQHHYVDPMQAAYVPPVTEQTAYQYQPQETAQPYAEAPAQSPAQSYDYSHTIGTEPTEYTPPITDADLPYENPGYSEAANPEGVSRPGHVTEVRGKRKRKKSKKEGSSLPPFITPRNAKVAGLAVALSVAGYFGYNRFVGGNDTPTELPVASVSAQETSMPALKMPAEIDSKFTAVNPAKSEISTEDPIGNYSDNGAAFEAVANKVKYSGSQTLQQAADGGNAIAQFQLGVTYLEAGQTKKGVKLVRAAANQNQPAAQYRLAKLYEAGIGVKTDPDMARKLTERAARAGNRIAMHDLGLYYAEGHGGLKPDLNTALKWFQKAAERSVVDSQYNLGILLGSTPEIPQDLVSAYFWFSVAAGQGDQFAASQLEGLKAKLSAEQLQAANQRIAQFKPVAINETANGIFREVPWTMPESNAIAPTAELVRDAQTLLGQLGYEVGTPDGAIGPKTREAVKAFERANGLPETGAVSGSLVDRLEAATGV